MGFPTYITEKDKNRLIHALELIEQFANYDGEHYDNIEWHKLTLTVTARLAKKALLTKS